MLITWLDFGGTLLETLFFVEFSLKISDVYFFKVKHSIGHISGMVGPIDVKRKGGASVGYWVNHVTLTFDLTHDLDLVVSGSKFEIALFEESGGEGGGGGGGWWLTWNVRDVSWSFMTMTVTYGRPWWGGWMYRIVTGATSDVGVLSTYLVVWGNGMVPAQCQVITWISGDCLSVRTLTDCGLVTPYGDRDLGQHWFR